MNFAISGATATEMDTAEFLSNSEVVALLDQYLKAKGGQEGATQEYVMLCCKQFLFFVSLLILSSET